MKNGIITLLILSFIFIIPMIHAQQLRTTVKIDPDSTIIPQLYGPQVYNVANSADIQVDREF